LAHKPPTFNARLGTSFGAGRGYVAACCAVCKDSTYALWNDDL